MSHLPRILPASILGASLVIGAALLTHAGPLDPPAGPVTPSYKTLSEVEPRTAISSANTPGDSTSVFVISKSGSYYLTGNVAASGKTAITVNASDVTIDLAGFRLSGDSGSLNGIFSTSSRITVRNGTVLSFGKIGVSIGGASCAVESVKVSGTGADAILVGTLGQVRDCAVSSSAARGIIANIASSVENCSVAGCTGSGIDVAQSTVTHCNVNNCGVGIQGNDVCSILDCNIHVNKGDGIRVTSWCHLARNNSSNNGSTTIDGAGVRALGIDNRIESNNLTANDLGVVISGTSNIILSNTCGDNTVNNYDIAANNRYGPIINISATGSAAAVGNSAASTLSSSDPWANFAY